jgi:hypothetical protein
MGLARIALAGVHSGRSLSSVASRRDENKSEGPGAQNADRVNSSRPVLDTRHSGRRRWVPRCPTAARSPAMCRLCRILLAITALALPMTSAGSSTARQPDDRELHVICVDRPKAVNVRVDRPGKTVTLVLHSNLSATDWDVSVTPSTNVIKVILGGENKQTLRGAGCKRRSCRGIRTRPGPAARPSERPGERAGGRADAPHTAAAKSNGGRA